MHSQGLGTLDSLGEKILFNMDDNDGILLLDFRGVILVTLIAMIHSLRPPPCTYGSYICETLSKHQYAFLFAALALASIGLGGIRFTMPTMGANQFDKANDRGNFFNWFFLSYYTANAISFTAIIYIQENVSWALGFGFCIIANAIGLAVFLIGKALAH